MKITKFEIQPLTIKFNTEVIAGKNKLKEKKSYKLNIKYFPGKNCEGELSVLPGFHFETLENCKRECDEILSRLKGKELNEKKLDFSKPFFNLYHDINWGDVSSPTMYALETSLLDHFDHLKHPKLTKIQQKISKYPVTINGLYFLDSKKEINLKDFENYQTIKIKIGQFDVKTEAKLLNEIFNKYPQFKYRLDGNRNFSLPNLIKLIDQIDTAKIEYLEEPLKDIALWGDFYKKHPIPLAVDESLPGLFSHYGPLPIGTTHWILKPTVIGGISKTLELIEIAKDEKIKCVISSTYEDKIGEKPLFFLAGKQNSFAPTDCGLDTSRYIVQNK